MSDHLCTDADSDRERTPGEGWLFWVLIALAAMAFAPCVILPAWRDYQAVRLVEQLTEVEVQRMEAEVNRQERLVSALLEDSAVIARVAQRELEYARSGELRVAVCSAGAADLPEPVTLSPVEPPVVVQRWQRWLPRWDYDAVFCDTSCRAVIMTLAGGLVIAAFWLFPPSRYPRPAGPGE